MDGKNFVHDWLLKRDLWKENFKIHKILRSFCPYSCLICKQPSILFFQNNKNKKLFFFSSKGIFVFYVLVYNGFVLSLLQRNVKEIYCKMLIYSGWQLYKLWWLVWPLLDCVVKIHLGLSGFGSYYFIYVSLYIRVLILWNVFKESNILIDAWWNLN